MNSRQREAASVRGRQAEQNPLSVLSYAEKTQRGGKNGKFEYTLLYRTRWKIFDASPYRQEK